MDEGFIRLLDRARELAGIPFRVNSGLRSVEHNRAVGGVADSSHLKGLAADIACTRFTRSTIVDALRAVGFTRIGVAANFVHCDLDPDKPRVEWTY